MSYVTIPATCKFCDVGLELQIDADYASMRDPHKLIPMAACDECASLRIEKPKLEGRVMRTASLIKEAREENDSKALSDLEGKLCAITRDYCELVRKWLSAPAVIWDRGIVDQILSQPGSSMKVLEGIWKMYRSAPLPELL